MLGKDQGMSSSTLNAAVLTFTQIGAYPSVHCEAGRATYRRAAAYHELADRTEGAEDEGCLQR